MIVSKCPVRISFAGGSTDLDAFLQKFGRGSVISFSADIYSYITVKTDKMGLNGLEKKYVVDYMKREVVDSIDEIKNDIARVALNYFHSQPTTVWFTSDIYASGSGLASSTSYLIALLNALQFNCNLNLTKRELCQLAHKLEKEFNPLTGFQDPYGCGLGGFNRIESDNTGKIKIENLDTDIFKKFDLYLVNTGQARSSTGVLKTIDPDKCLDLLKASDDMYFALLKKNYEDVLGLIKEGWKIKKTTGKIIEDKKVIELDELLSSNKNILAHRLLGAGNGGYFLVFTKKDLNIEKYMKNISIKFVKIDVCHAGAVCTKIK
jgi:D-glycero-alpha-D-manno-heptose-7-phosphate kinase